MFSPEETLMVSELANNKLHFFKIRYAQFYCLL